jgi:hypothetical protein
VELALDDGDPAEGGLELARIAADVGHRVDPVDDVPLRDLLWIAHRAGDDRTALMWAWQLLAANGVDVPADLPDYESYRVVDEVFPNGLRAAAAASG